MGIVHSWLRIVACGLGAVVGGGGGGGQGEMWAVAGIGGGNDNTLMLILFVCVFLQRCLAAHWLHSQSLLSSQCGQCGGKAGRQNGTKKEQPMDDGTPQDGDDSDDDGGDSAVQEQVLDFVLDFGDEKPEVSTVLTPDQGTKFMYSIVFWFSCAMRQPATQ